MLQRCPRSGADVADQRRGRGSTVELRRDAALPHGEDLGECIVLEVLELRLVRGGMHDHLVPSVQRGVLVGDDAHGPAGTVGGAAAGTEGVHLGRRERLVAGAEGALSAARLAALPAGRWPAPRMTSLPLTVERQFATGTVTGRCHRVRTRASRTASGCADEAVAATLSKLAEGVLTPYGSPAEDQGAFMYTPRSPSLRCRKTSLMECSWPCSAVLQGQPEEGGAGTLKVGVAQRASQRCPTTSAAP